MSLAIRPGWQAFYFGISTIQITTMGTREAPLVPGKQNGICGEQPKGAGATEKISLRFQLGQRRTFPETTALPIQGIEATDQSATRKSSLPRISAPPIRACPAAG